MLIIENKSGSGILTSYSGGGIFDFGKILLKKALNSNLIKRASKAINSELGQTTIRAVKRAAESDLGQALKEKAVSEVKRRALDVSNKALDKISVPTTIRDAAKSEIGQQLQKRIISEVGKRTDRFGVPNIAQTAFHKLGIAEPKKKKKSRKRKRKGSGFVYPQTLINQFGSGIVLE